MKITCLPNGPYTLSKGDVTLRREDGTTVKPGDYGIEIEWVTLGF